MAFEPNQIPKPVSSRRRAATGLQYATVVGLIAVVAIASVAALGGSVGIMLARVSNSITGAGNVSAGGSGGTVAVTPDTTPDAFSFSAVASATVGSTQNSNIVTITGINTATAVSVSGGGSPQVIIAGGSPASSGTIANGQTLALRATAPSVGGATHTISVTVGTATASWTVTTSATAGQMQVSDVNGNWINGRFVLCNGGAACTEAQAKSACAGVGGRLVSHASDGNAQVLSLGATNSCNHSYGYYRTLDSTVATAGNCLVGLSNVDWSNCCGQTMWHGNVYQIQTPATGAWGFIDGSSTGYQSSGVTSLSGTIWGCGSETFTHATRGGCTAYYVACAIP